MHSYDEQSKRPSAPDSKIIVHDQHVDPERDLNKFTSLKSLDRNYSKYLNEKSTANLAAGVTVSHDTITGSPKRFFLNKGESPALASALDTNSQSVKNSNKSCGG